MKLSLRLTTPLFLSALVSMPAAAQSWRPRPRPPQGMAQLCLLNADGSGQFAITTTGLVASLLSSALPTRFSLVLDQETCDDGKDNDCNGEIDDKCSQQNGVWDAGSDCDACMESQCAVFSNRCDGDQACQDALDCVLEAKCLDRDIGPIACFCGEDVSLERCMDSPVSELDGACMAEFSKSVIPSWIPGPELGGILAGKMFLCMTRQCADPCSENIYNHEVEE